LRLLPYLAGIGLVLGAYAWGDHHGATITEAAWAARWTARDLAETQAKDAALAAHKAAQDAADARNNAIMESLSNAAKERDAALNDAAFARRLLAAAARPAAAGGAVPPAADQPGAPETGGTGQGESLGSLVAEAIGECRRNADRLDALVAEITPQLVAR
jgi:hypothetical protein